MQIAGRKRVYIYPNTPPFIRPEYLEDIALFGIEVDIPYKEWYDAHATVLDIGPGQMLSWPMNAPHRVENLDTFSISMTISYDDQDIRRAQVVNLANAMTSGGGLWLRGVDQHQFAVFQRGDLHPGFV